jgi:hypothetical protein
MKTFGMLNRVVRKKLLDFKAWVELDHVVSAVLHMDGQSEGRK